MLNYISSKISFGRASSDSFITWKPFNRLKKEKGIMVPYHYFFKNAMKVKANFSNANVPDIPE